MLSKQLPKLANILLVSIAFLLFINWLALTIQDAVFTPRALYDIRQAMLGEEYFHWPMESKQEIRSTDINSVVDLRFEDSLLLGVAQDGDPYFWLNFKGRAADANIYDRLTIRLYSSDRSALQLVHRVPGKRGVLYGYYSQNVGVKAGWQELDIALQDLTWDPAYYPGVEAGPPGPADWGGQPSSITGLRLDPVGHENLEFRIDEVMLLRGNVPKQNPIAAPVDFSLDPVEFNLLNGGFKSLANQIKNRGAGQLVIDQTPIRIAPVNRYLREKLISIAPNAIFLPRLLENRDIYKAALEQRQDVVNPLDHIAPGVTLISAVLLIFVVAYLVACRLAYVNYHPGAGLIFLVVASTLIWLTDWQILVWHQIMIASATAAIFMLILGHRSESWWVRFGLVSGTRLSWALTIILTLILGTVVVLMSFFHDSIEPQYIDNLRKSLLQYPFWALFQQFYLGPILTRTLESCARKTQYALLANRSTIALIAGAIFSLLHTPNFALMATTFILGVSCSYLFQIGRSIIPLAIYHGIVGALFQNLLQAPIRFDGQVGMSYYSWLW